MIVYVKKTGECLLGFFIDVFHVPCGEKQMWNEETDGKDLAMVDFTIHSFEEGGIFKISMGFLPIFKKI